MIDLEKIREWVKKGKRSCNIEISKNNYSEYAESVWLYSYTYETGISVKDTNNLPDDDFFKEKVKSDLLKKLEGIDNE